MSVFQDNHRKVKPLDEQADWVCSFVQDSRESRSMMDDIWTETEQNFLVRPLDDVSLGSSTRHPLQSTLSDTSTPRSRSLTVLKDPETFQEVMTIVSKIMLALFPQDDGYVEALAVGFEDVHRSNVASKLIEHVSRLPGHYRVFLEWLLSMGIYGKGIIQSFWHYQEELRQIRDIDYDEFGNPLSFFSNGMVVTYDDPRMNLVDVRDFYNDPGYIRMQDMAGAANRFKINASEALRRAARGLYNKEMVLKAIESQSAMDSKEHEDHPEGEDPTSTSGTRESHPDFAQLIGYEYYGETPYRASKDAVKYEDGISRRVVTVLVGQTVRSDPWPHRLPFFDGGIIPRLNSFWDIAPAEVIRYDQDFADTLKMMLADAVVRMTHPPLVYDKNSDMDLSKLRAFRPRVPIGASFRGGSPVEMLKYNPPLGDAFGMYSAIKGQMREASGALGAIQGLGLGTKRFSASEAAVTYQQAMDRPELFAQVVEREHLPPLAKYHIELYGSMLHEDPVIAAEELQKRVGESEVPVQITDILVDFDVKFVGSRTQSNQQREQAFQNILQASANPIVAQVIPWVAFLRKWFRQQGAHDIAAMVGNEELIRLNLMLTQLAAPNQQTGNGNGETPSAPPSGLLPAQVSGGMQE